MNISEKTLKKAFEFTEAIIVPQIERIKNCFPDQYLNDRYPNGLKVSDIYVKTRNAEAVICRFLVWWYVSKSIDKIDNYYVQNKEKEKIIGTSLARLGAVYKYKHCTVIHSKKHIQNMIKTNRAFAKFVDENNDLLYEGIYRIINDIEIPFIDREPTDEQFINTEKQW